MQRRVCWSLALVSSASLLASAQENADGKMQPLSLPALVELVETGAPDDLVAGQIRARGIEFPVNQTLLQSLHEMKAGPKTIDILRGLNSTSARDDEVEALVQEIERALHYLEHDEAHRLMEALTEIDRDHPVVLKVQGLTYLRQGDAARAERYLRSALSAGQSVPLEMQHLHDNFFFKSFCAGTFTISQDRVDFQSMNDRSHNFDVPLQDVTEYAIVRDEWVLHLELLVPEEGGGETKKKRNYDFSSRTANIVTSDSHPPLVSCEGCEPFLEFVYGLVESVAGKPGSS